METEFKDPFNAFYIIAFLLVFLVPLLPAWLGWFKVLS